MMCQRCVLDNDSDDKICPICGWQEKMEELYPRSNKILEYELRKMKGGEEYDCVVGVSGGQDSTWLLHLVKSMGLNPLACHYDNTFNGVISVENLMQTLEKLEVDLETYVANVEDVEEIARAFMRAGTPDLDAQTDIALTTCMYKAAEKAGTKWILDAHDFRSEGSTDFKFFYFDQAYIDDVMKKHAPKYYSKYEFGWRAQFGLTIKEQLSKWWPGEYKRIRPLYWDATPRKQRREILEETYGWKPYGGKHRENRWTEFVDYFWLPTRFGIDLRKVFWSAQIRSGEITKSQVLEELKKPALTPKEATELVIEICDRLGMTTVEMEQMLVAPKKSYKDFDNYLPEFRKLAPEIKKLADDGKVVQTFYEKYCR